MDLATAEDLLDHWHAEAAREEALRPHDVAQERDLPRFPLALDAYLERLTHPRA